MWSQIFATLYMQHFIFDYDFYMSHYMYSAIYRLLDASSTISFQLMDGVVIIADDV